MTIGQKLSPILVEIEDTLWDFEAISGGKPKFTNEGFRAAMKIMMSALMDKMWELSTDENINFEIRKSMAEKAGKDFRQFIKTYTNIDTHEMYKLKQ